MSFFDRVKNLFSAKSTAEVLILNENIPLANESNVVLSSENIHFSTEMDNVPFWLENEDALRDEGVVFGLSEARAEEKVGAIRNYFAHQTADLEKIVGYNSEKIGELNLFIEQKQSRINEFIEKTRTLEKREPTDHQLPRTSVGIILSLAMCVGNYFLIDASILTNFPQNHYVISLGIFLAGMFNLFNSKSVFHEKDTPISWKNLLEEVGMPLAASIFVFVQSLDYQVFIRSFALLLFVFFLFLFAGKLLLSNLTLLKADSGIWLANRRLENDKVNKTQIWEEEMMKLNNEIDEQRIEKWKIIDALKAPEAELKRLNEKREMLIKLFESEFNLARSYREKLTSKQMREILK